VRLVAKHAGGGVVYGGWKRLLVVKVGLLNGDGRVRAAIRASTARRI